MEKTTQTNFDLIVHRRDKKTGRVTETTPYRLFVKDGVEYFERPKGSGNLFFRNGETAGRMEQNTIKRDAAHIEWVAPLTADQKLAQQLAAQTEDLKKLQAELDAYKREKKYAPKGAEVMKKTLGDSENSAKEA